MHTVSVAKATGGRRSIRWEAVCITLEMVGAGGGVFVGLGLGNWAAAGALLWAVGCVSITARAFRYGGVLE